MALCANTAGIDMTQEQAYATWWWEEGSGILPLPTEDMEEFAHRITQIAWSNAAYKEREACAKVCETNVWSEDVAWWRETTKSEVAVESSVQCAEAIRARGQV